MTATKPRVGADLRYPLLEPGDHLSRAEFERRYNARPDIKKAELVQGVVYVPSPARFEEHAEPDNLLGTWLRIYALTHPGVRVGSNGTVRLSDVDEVQPDSMMWRAGGEARLDEARYIEGAPELVVEITASSASYDLHTKKESYRRAGVREYIVWRTLDGEVDWFRLTGGQYEQVEQDPDGAIESSQFPGLRLEIRELLAGDDSVVLPPGMRRQPR
ncbi:MAG: Uma2 family endonuclease [Tepidiformaceae bacterium]